MTLVKEYLEYTKKYKALYINNCTAHTAHPIMGYEYGKI